MLSADAAFALAVPLPVSAYVCMAGAGGSACAYIWTCTVMRRIRSARGVKENRHIARSRVVYVTPELRTIYVELRSAMTRAAPPFAAPRARGGQPDLDLCLDVDVDLGRGQVARTGTRGTDDLDLGGGGEERGAVTTLRNDWVEEPGDRAQSHGTCVVRLFLGDAKPGADAAFCGAKCAMI
ncbi:hypothetical protein DFH09DRAFT_1143576 [Mycena vulgaris]|nr:hypothetical protein DFH09DRAFT_1143576 [Mycena vulgaris]